jgi:hypothetical protein
VQLHLPLAVGATTSTTGRDLGLAECSGEVGVRKCLPICCFVEFDMDVKNIRKLVWVAIGYGVISLTAVLYNSVSTAQKSAEERRIADQSWNLIAGAVKDFRDAKGCYPASLNDLSLDPQVTRNFRYWTNGDGGYSVRWEGKYGFRSTTSTSQSDKRKEQK